MWMLVGQRDKFLFGDDCCVLDGNKEQWCESSGVAVINRSCWIVFQSYKFIVVSCDL